jgi:hypothetical protein
MVIWALGVRAQEFLRCAEILGVNMRQAAGSYRDTRKDLI